MAIDRRFSKDAFLRESERHPSSPRLVHALEVEIQRELHEAILPKVRDIVARLNDLGHDLREYTPPIPGDIGFRDEAEEGTCLLRLGVDTIVSLGFMDADDNPGDTQESDDD